MSHEAIATKPLWIGLAATVLACGVATAAVHVLLQEAKPRTREERWYMNVPREVNEVEAAPFSARTDAESQAQAAKLRLRSYGWVARDEGVVHIPIDVAYDVYLRGRR